MEGDSFACTNACTTEGENANATAPDAQDGRNTEGIAPADTTAAPTPLDVLAQAIANLSADDRAKLTAMLTNAKDGKR